MSNTTSQYVSIVNAVSQDNDGISFARALVEEALSRDNDGFSFERAIAEAEQRQLRQQQEQQRANAQRGYRERQQRRRQREAEAAQREAEAERRQAAREEFARREREAEEARLARVAASEAQQQQPQHQQQATTVQGSGQLVMTREQFNNAVEAAVVAALQTLGVQVTSEPVEAQAAPEPVEEEDDEPVCPVCYEPTTRTTRCGHPLCQDCDNNILSASRIPLSPWGERTSYCCPICCSSLH